MKRIAYITHIRNKNVLQFLETSFIMNILIYFNIEYLLEICAQKQAAYCICETRFGIYLFSISKWSKEIKGMGTCGISNYVLVFNLILYHHSPFFQFCFPIFHLFQTFLLISIVDIFYIRNKLVIQSQYIYQIRTKH